MVTLNGCASTDAPGRFTYRQAERIAHSVAGEAGQGIILIDLGGVTETTTAALARLVVLRRKLRHSGCDLMISGIDGRARDLYTVQRFDELLPLRDCA